MSIVGIKYQGRAFAKKPALPFGLQVERFTDGSGTVYEWAPKWQEVREIFIVAAATEIFNTERSGKWDELEEFADTARHTIDMLLQQAAKRLKGPNRHPSLKAGA